MKLPQDGKVNNITNILFPTSRAYMHLKFAESYVCLELNETYSEHGCLGQFQSAVSGLNRGLAGSEDDLRKADAAAKELEDAGGLVDLSADLDKLQGRWKLIYSSAFSSRTLGGSRPGPPIGRLLPITLGQVQ